MNRCCYCERTRIPTNHLILNGGTIWIEFCAECGERETLHNRETGETLTVRQLFDRSVDAPPGT